MTEVQKTLAINEEAIAIPLETCILLLLKANIYWAFNTMQMLS